MSHPKHAESAHDILDVIRRRWSPRAFDAEREVSLGDVRTLFEAARWAPSSFNEQPWRFVLADRRRSAEAFEAMHATLAPSNREWAGAAAALILVSVKLVLTRTGSANRHAAYDAGQAVGFLTLQATALNLAIRQMEGFDHDAARAACGVPDEFEPLVMMTLGYAGNPDLLTIERHRTAEVQPRRRSTLEEIVFEGSWGKPLT